MTVEKLESGGRIVGTMFRLIRNPALALTAKHSNLDFFMLDMEHSTYSVETVADIMRVARAAGIDGFVRAPELSKAYVSRILDAGATGVMVPMLETVDQAKKLANWSKFPPVGNRGLGTMGDHTQFGSIKTVPFMERANKETLSIAQIETENSIDVVEDIAAVDGIDALLVGPLDLSISLGVPGDIFNEKVSNAIQKVVDAARKHNKIFGMHGNDKMLEKWIPEGLTLIMSELDINFISNSLKNIADKYKETK
jgi:2-keto-3-deoxy-L-rhamnonate aldolase RhmA